MYCCRADGRIIVEPSAAVPTVEAIVVAHEEGLEALSRDVQAEDPEVDQVDAREDDFKAPDVPAVDLA